MSRRLAVAGLSAAALVLSGCLGPVSLHEAVLGYDHTVSRLGREILLVNIARLHHGLPAHFTLATSIAATFDYQTNAAILGPLTDVGLNVGVSAAEKPCGPQLLHLRAIGWSAHPKPTMRIRRSTGHLSSE
jgi:hypothetical protein